MCTFDGNQAILFEKKIEEKVALVAGRNLRTLCIPRFKPDKQVLSRARKSRQQYKCAKFHSSRAFAFEMAKSVRSLRSKLLFHGGSPNAIRSLVFLTRGSSDSVAEVSRTAIISPERDQIAASSEQPLRSLSFNNGKNAFRSKTTWEIIRALAIFRLCSFDFLVNRNKEVSKCYFKSLYHQ